MIQNVYFCCQISTSLLCLPVYCPMNFGYNHLIVSPGHLFSLQRLTSSLSPGHCSPPKKGPWHTLCLCWLPPPQVLVQPAQELQSCHWPSTGHSLRKQSRVWRHSPWHSRPPYEGPLHSRVRFIVPFEQDEEQELQMDHSFHTPSTTEENTWTQKKKLKIILNV